MHATEFNNNKTRYASYATSTLLPDTSAYFFSSSRVREKAFLADPLHVSAFNLYSVHEHVL